MCLYNPSFICICIGTRLVQLRQAVEKLAGDHRAGQVALRQVGRYRKAFNDQSIGMGGVPNRSAQETGQRNGRDGQPELEHQFQQATEVTGQIRGLKAANLNVRFGSKADIRGWNGHLNYRPNMSAFE